MAATAEQLEQWEDEGYTAACESAKISEMTQSSGASSWDEAWINGCGSAAVAAELGLDSLYSDGVLSDAASELLSAYNAACTRGWNRRVAELRQTDERQEIEGR